MARSLYAVDGSYRPDALVADTSQQRTFTGHPDPATLTGVALAAGDRWEAAGDVAQLPAVPPTPGWALVLDDEFTSLDRSRWAAYDNSTFGAPDRVQRYMAANAVIGNPSAGSTLGSSLKLLSKREAIGGNAFTAGMLDSKTVNTFYPRYGRFEVRCKIPHGQGLWPAFWLTAKNGGATTAEYDIVEYFHGQLPGKNSSTIHGTDNTGTFHANRYTNNGNPANGVGGRTFFEAPTYTPGWHVWAAEIVPVTDASGNTTADPTQPSSYVRLTVFLDGQQVWRIVDTSALYYTTNGGSADSFWNIYVQGCQIDGKFVGHPDDPLGYSSELGACLIGGTAPNACSITAGGMSVIRAGAPGSSATFADPATTFEIDYIRVWKWTG